MITRKINKLILFYFVNHTTLIYLNDFIKILYIGLEDLFIKKRYLNFFNILLING